MIKGILENNRNVNNELLFSIQLGSIQKCIDKNREMMCDINRTLKLLEKPIYKEERKQ